MVTAIKVGWTGFLMTLVLVYVPALTAPYRSHLFEAGLLPTEAALLIELGAMLELLGPEHEPVLIMGVLNTCTATFAPSVED